MAEPVDSDAQVPWRVFAAVGGVLAVISVIYGLTASEESGKIMLTVAAVLGLWCATFFWRNLRRSEASGVGSGHQAMYLPEASPWPFGIGLGVTLVLNGLLIGSWFLVPGVMVLAVSIAGFARQSRQRL